MYFGPSLATQSPAVIVHLVFAVGALALGPLALRANKGSRWHRALGYAWVTLMLAAAISSVFIRDFRIPNFFGYTAIHLLTIATFVGVGLGIWHISRRNIVRHRRVMHLTYGALLLAGSFAFLPDRYLGGLLREHLYPLLA